MPHTSLRLVHSDQTRPSPETSSDTSLTLPSNRSNSRTAFAEPLGNKIQRLIILSPNHAECIELLVDHILKSVETGQRGLY